MAKFASFIRSRDGATAIEYGLVAALISVGLLIGLESLSDSLLGLFNHVSDTVESAWG
ncbi:Flp family type IVb pilin [Sinorhizobium terangae]|uniref:Flp family type IVb pilin n=1 Tax=Sinorhizobium terangae TaxID=110322 RepID=A0A6N7LR72_SINTE|nr:Flp family type IVb pilin [Sinorhizobium terangae]MBB4185797.1 pilus assembly protein Flp/PilA [Sinorhizobium terangae]MQX19408.1 Flp family type IVb pilin [Sinorhizobium terangae]WFU46854.1 Flp family type IVb pilin [Sinorhizobium terangae]